MDAGTGGVGGSRKRKAGRRRLRIGALALGSLLTMHFRITSSALTGSYWIFILILLPAMLVLGNPMRHFEVYLGQWSISGPGRAFRIIPMFDGIGIAIAISSLIRAIVNCAFAGMIAVYMIHVLSDESLPYTKCRGFDLKTYEPELVPERFRKLRAHDDDELLNKLKENETELANSTQEEMIFKRSVPAPCIRCRRDLRDLTYDYYDQEFPENGDPVNRALITPRELQVCKNPYDGKAYPAYCGTAAYNFFYVEIANYQPDSYFKSFNMNLAIAMAIIWAVIWCCMIYERVSHGRLIWNNTSPWTILVPLLWTASVVVSGVLGLIARRPKILSSNFRLNSGSTVGTIGDAFETAIYLHMASMGPEIIHGKGLNHYASGHIDPNLNSENMWHTSLLFLLTALGSSGSALCALCDLSQVNLIVNSTLGSTSWILPMYSRCACIGTYTHLKSGLIFSGLIFSYVAVAYVLVKSALHTIFEYKVKLVFIEQVIVGALVILCALLSMFFATNGGLPLLESVDSFIAGLVMPVVCFLELTGMLFIYHGSDFVSDMNVSMEDSECGSRMSTQWTLLPFIVLILLALRIWSMCESPLPTQALLLALVPLVVVLVAVPLRACHNAYFFLRRT